MSNSLWPHGLYSLPGSSVHGILQARILEWVAISSSTGSSKTKDQTCISWVSCIGRRVLYRCTTWEPSRLKKMVWPGSSWCFNFLFLDFLHSEPSHPREKKMKLVGHLGSQISPQIDFSHHEFCLDGSEQVSGVRWLVPLDTSWPTSPF